MILYNCILQLLKIQKREEKERRDKSRTDRDITISCTIVTITTSNDKLFSVSRSFVCILQRRNTSAAKR